MSSKLKVALSKVSHLPLFKELALKHFFADPRPIAGKFYLKTLPRMATLPRVLSSAPRVNLWLWLIGYLRIQWPGPQVKAPGRISVANLGSLLREAHKYLLGKATKNSSLVKSRDFLQETSVAQGTKKWGNR